MTAKNMHPGAGRQENGVNGGNDERKSMIESLVSIRNGLFRTLTLVANSYAAFSAAKGEQRVFARGVPVNHSPSRTKFRAAAVARCCKWVLASPT
jgi:hypothetical protein